MATNLDKIPPLRGGQGRTDKEVQDQSDIGFYLWCAGVVVVAIGIALILIRVLA